MPNKTEEYLALACKTADSFSRQWEHWAEFLITAARLYKYSYLDQLMIYAQRPDATACAEYDVSTIISLRKPSTRCGPEALWHLSPAAIRWTVRILLPGSILRSVRIPFRRCAHKAAYCTACR